MNTKLEQFGGFTGFIDYPHVNFNPGANAGPNKARSHDLDAVLASWNHGI
jgi:hypothetical protein